MSSVVGHYLFIQHSLILIDVMALYDCLPHSALLGGSLALQTLGQTNLGVELPLQLHPQVLTSALLQPYNRGWS